MDKTVCSEDLELGSRLREVFDVCDEGRKGYITANHFIELAKEFTNSQKQTDDKFIDRIISVLDSDGNGKISFDDFCKGVKEILQSNNSVLANGNIDKSVIDDFLTVRRLSTDGNKSPEVYETNIPPDLFKQKNNNSFLDNNNNNNNKDKISNSSEDDADSGAWSSNMNEIIWSSSTPIRHGEDSHSEIRTTNSLPSNENENANDFNYFSRHNPLTPLSTPRSSFRSNPGSRTGSFRNTPRVIGNQLYRNTGSSANCSEMLLDAADSQVSELSDKVLKLEDQLANLSESQKLNEDKHIRMKEENAQLVQRVHVLEEQLREIEQLNEERMKHEKEKHKELMLRTEKDKINQIELLTHSLKLLEKEYNDLKVETPVLRGENEKLKRRNFDLERDIAKLRQECSELNDEKTSLQENLQMECTKMNKERQTHSQLLDDLTQELNELRVCKSDFLKLSPALRRSGKFKSSESVIGSDHETHVEQLKEQVNHLKKENYNLKNQVEELQALILNESIDKGRNLLQDQTSSANILAVELDEVPKDELVKALQKEQEINKKLRDYIDFMTLKILENNPSLLEVRKKSNNANKK